MTKFSTAGWSDEEILSYAYHNPDKVLRSWRTNSPGAINYADWQQNRPGWLGVTKDDGHGNVTSVWRTPEDGVAAFIHLLVDRYSLGDKITLELLAEKYSGGNKNLIASYKKGWLHYSNLGWNEVFEKNDPDALAKVAYAVFRHESGKKMHVSRKTILRAAQRELGHKVVDNPITGVSRGMAGSAASTTGGVVVLAESFPVVAEAVQQQEANLSSGEIIKILVGSAIVFGSLLMIYSRWDDAGKPSLFGGKRPRGYLTCL